MLLLSVASLLVAAVTRQPAIVILFVLSYVLLDWTLLRLSRSARRASADANCGLMIEGDCGLAIAGCVIRLDVQLSAKRSIRGALVTPIVPAALSVVEPGGVQVSLRAGQNVRFAFSFGAARPADCVFPGVVVRFASPLRLFSDHHLLPSRQQLTVLPDYVSTSHPQLSWFMRRMRIGQDRQHVIRGLGTDFHEMRPYRYPDSISRVDWNATARRQSLIVREYEEPCEFTIRIVLDGSLEMACGTEEGDGFANVVTLIAKLAFIAGSQGMNMVVSVYDQAVVLESRLGNGVHGFARMLSELMTVPRQALVRRGSGGTGLTSGGTRIQNLAVKALRQWGIDDSGDLVERFYQRYFAQSNCSGNWANEFLADVNPSALADLPDRCGSCDGVVFPDESLCAKCGAALAPTQMPARAACAAGLIARSIKRSRGREMLLFISTLQGGEACDELGRLMRLAATGHRRVHVIVPAAARLQDARPSNPGSLGHQPVAAEMLENMDKLNHAARVAEFRESMLAADIKMHSIDNHADLEEVVASLLLNEVHAA